MFSFVLFFPLKLCPFIYFLSRKCISYLSKLLPQPQAHCICIFFFLLKGLYNGLFSPECAFPKHFLLQNIAVFLPHKYVLNSSLQYLHLNFDFFIYTTLIYIKILLLYKPFDCNDSFNSVF